MSGFIEGENRYQFTLFPESVDDYVEEDSVVRVIIQWAKASPVLSVIESIGWAVVAD